MKKALLVLILVFGASLMATADPINVQVYQNVPFNFTTQVSFDPGTWLNPLAAFSTNSINFTTPAQWPAGLISSADNAWGAVLTGNFLVSAAGAYTFNMLTDDGATLYVNGRQTALNDPIAHATKGITETIFLNAGLNSFSLVYYEWNGTPETLVLTLPEGVTYTPEPSSLIMLGTGLLGAAGGLYRKMRLMA